MHAFITQLNLRAGSANSYVALSISSLLRMCDMCTGSQLVVGVDHIDVKLITQTQFTTFINTHANICFLYYDLQFSHTRLLSFVLPWTQLFVRFSWHWTIDDEFFSALICRYFNFKNYN